MGGGNGPKTKQGTRCPWEGWGGPPPPSLGCPIMLSVRRGIKPWRGSRDVTPNFESVRVNFCRLAVSNYVYNSTTGDLSMLWLDLEREGDLTPMLLEVLNMLE